MEAGVVCGVYIRLSCATHCNQHQQRNVGNYSIFDIKDEQVVATVHDQGANYKLASQMLEEDHGWKNLKCAGHCLQLSLKSGV